MGFLRQIGAVFVRLTTHNEMSAGLKQAEAEVKASSAKMQASAGGVNAGFKEVGQSIKGSYSGLKTFVGSLTGAIGLVSKILGLWGLIASGIYLAANAVGFFTKKAEEAGRTTEELLADVKKLGLAATGGEKEPFASYVKNIADLQEEIEKAKENIAALDSPAIRGDPFFDANSAREGQLKRLAVLEQALAITKASYTSDLNKKTDKENQEIADKEEKRDDDRRQRIIRDSADELRSKQKLKEITPQDEAEIEFNTAQLVLEQKKKDEEALHEQRMKYLEEEAKFTEQRWEAAIKRLEGLRSLAGGSVSGDIRTTNALLKQLIDSQR